MNLPVLRLHRSRQLLCWLVLAMLLAPTLGRIHQVLHPAEWQGAGAAAHVHVVQGPAGESAADNWLLALFAGHSHSDCQLHDQLNAWAGPPMAGQPLPHGLPEELPRHGREQGASTGCAAFFDPRAPPTAAA